MIEDYIKQLLSMEPDSGLSPEDLHAIARDLGLSPQDLQRVEALADDHTTRGRHFLANGVIDDGIDELTRAVVLRPFSTDLLCELASAHRDRYRQNRADGDRQAAERLARRAIAVDADCRSAYQLLGELGNRSMTWSTRQVIAVAATAAMATAALAVALTAWFSTPAQHEHVRKNTHTGPSAPANVHETSTAPAADPAKSAPIGAGTSAPGVERIATALVETNDSADIEVAVQSSQLQRYSGGSFSYTLNTTLTVGKRTLQALSGRVELVDASGAVKVYEPVEWYSDHRPTLRPGDSVPVHVLIYQDQPAPAIATARLIMDLSKRSAAARHYDPGVAVDVVWPTVKASHIDIAVWERANQDKTGILGDRARWITLAVENRGEGAIQSLEFDVVVRDASGATLAKSHEFVVMSSGPALAPGQVFVVRAIASWEGDAEAADYAVIITEFE